MNSLEDMGGHFTVMNQPCIIRNIITSDLTRKMSGDTRLAVTQSHLFFVYLFSLLYILGVGERGVVQTRTWSSEVNIRCLSPSLSIFGFETVCLTEL